MNMKKRNGFTLLELIIAFGILCIGFLSLSNLSIAMLKANKHSQNKTAALQLAQEKMESIKSLSFSELQGGVEFDLTIGNVGTLFQRETIVQKDSSLAEITVRVVWPGISGPGRSHATELNTRIAG
jgi:prepilin-type N-terminal cleavage/methylation domain-containing protein